MLLFKTPSSSVKMSEKRSLLTEFTNEAKRLSEASISLKSGVGIVMKRLSSSASSEIGTRAVGKRHDDEKRHMS